MTRLRVLSIAILALVFSMRPVVVADLDPPRWYCIDGQVLDIRAWDVIDFDIDYTPYPVGPGALCLPPFRGDRLFAGLVGARPV